MKRLGLFLIFLVITPLNLGISLLALGLLAPHRETAVSASQGLLNPSKSPLQLYAALPQAVGKVLGTATVNDARPIIIRKYLEKYNSPLAHCSDLFVTVSDKYGLDWRLLVAIAQQESNLGKKVPDGSYNPFGWGIHSKGTLHFSSWEEGIETVAKGIKEEYVDKGYTTPEEIMSKYTPSSNGSWSFGVNQFIQELEYGKVD